MGSARRSGGQGHLLSVQAKPRAGLCTEVWEFHLGAQSVSSSAPSPGAECRRTPCSPLAVQKHKVNQKA